MHLSIEYVIVVTKKVATKKSGVITMEILDILKNLGFTEYEAKTYIALLTNAPSTGYAIAKNSGVPRSKIYEVINNLVERGDILESPGNPPLYTALPAKELIASRRAKSEETLAAAEKSLEQLGKAENDKENIWNIKGYDAIVQKVNKCIRNSRKRILIEIWSEDFSQISDNLEFAANRGVDISIISYGKINADFAHIYPHDMSEEITSEYGGRWIVMSCDDKEVVAGAISLGDDSRAAWTGHQGLVMPITEVVIHDLYIAEMLNAHRDILEKTFGKDLIDLRKKFAIYPDKKKHYID